MQRLQITVEQLVDIPDNTRVQDLDSLGEFLERELHKQIEYYINNNCASIESDYHIYEATAKGRLQNVKQ